MNRKLGWSKPDSPDFRDFKYSPVAIKPPQVVYLIRPPVQDQGDKGSCVDNAITTAMEAVMIDESKPMQMLSRMFAYNNYRIKQGIPLTDDSGGSIRDTAKLVAKEGICHESTFPYTDVNFERVPPPDAYQEALTHRILSYFRLSSLNDMLNCMASGYGFVCGISIYSSFEQAVNGTIPMPQTSEEYLGGHALWFWGYDQHKKIFHGQNSWGESWGDKGMFTIPFDYLANDGLASDFWTVRK